MLERFLTQSAGGSKDDTEYLLERMDRMAPAEPSREANAPGAALPKGVSESLTSPTEDEEAQLASPAAQRVAALQ